MAPQMASQDGDEAVVSLLLDNGAEGIGKWPQRSRKMAARGRRCLQRRGIIYGAALKKASHRGNEVVVWLLIDNGANCNTQSGGWGGIHIA